MIIRALAVTVLFCLGLTPLAAVVCAFTCASTRAVSADGTSHHCEAPPPSSTHVAAANACDAHAGAEMAPALVTKSGHAPAAIPTPVAAGLPPLAAAFCATPLNVESRGSPPIPSGFPVLRI